MISQLGNTISKGNFSIIIKDWFQPKQNGRSNGGNWHILDKYLCDICSKYKTGNFRHLVDHMQLLCKGDGSLD